MEEMGMSLPDNILNAMSKHNAKPTAFLVEDSEVEGFLKKVSEIMGIPVERKERLHQAREALNGFRNFNDENLKL
jgi:hypothetical protein